VHGGIDRAGRREESKMLSEQRIRRLRHQDSLMLSLATDARKRLAKFPVDSKAAYSALLPDLIGQSLATLMGRDTSVKDVEVRVRSVDLPLLEGKTDATGQVLLNPSLLPKVRAAMEDVLKREAAAAKRALAEAEALSGAAGLKTHSGETEEKLDVALPDAFYVRADARLDAEGDRIGGGVILSTMGGRIIVDNSLHARLELSLHDLQHILRSTLFGEPSAPVSYE
jgi:hypothetical protein